MSRTDLDVSLSGNATGSKKFFDPNGVLVSDQTWSGPLYTYREIRRGNITPNYKTKKAVGAPLPSNTFYYLKESQTYPSGQRVWEVPNLGRETQNGLIDVASNFGWDPLDKTSADESAVWKILSRLKDRKVDLSVMFGERRETAKFIGDTALRVADSLRAMRNKQYRTAFDILGGFEHRYNKKAKKWLPPAPSRYAAANWLQWQFGVKPILSDIESSALAIYNALERNPPRGRVSASHTIDYSYQQDMSENWGVPTLFREWGQYTRKYVLYFSQDSVLPTFTALGLTNLPATVWELTALTFVSDWFLNVGKYLDALDAHIGLSFEGGCTTTFERRTRHIVGSGGQVKVYLAGGPLGYSRGNFRATKKLVEMRRENVVTWPYAPLPRFTTPWSSSDSAGRGVSLASLIVQRLQKH